MELCTYSMSMACMHQVCKNHPPVSQFSRLSLSLSLQRGNRDCPQCECRVLSPVTALVDGERSRGVRARRRSRERCSPGRSLSGRIHPKIVISRSRSLLPRHRTNAVLGEEEPLEKSCLGASAGAPPFKFSSVAAAAAVSGPLAGVIRLMGKWLPRR